jgi:methylated-DNA-protein-cysteine methyltransferase-like protein
MRDAAFGAAVLKVVRMIPRGHVATYGQIAALAGRARAARAGGRVVRSCPPGVPWHRVINHQGGISRRANAGGMLTQRVLLQGEGITLRRGRVPLARFRWEEEPCGKPRSRRLASTR